jgi:hypothetical protein
MQVGNGRLLFAFSGASSSVSPGGHAPPHFEDGLQSHPSEKKIQGVGYYLNLLSTFFGR